MNKIQWKPEYCGLEFGVISLADFFGPKPGQTIMDVIAEIKVLSGEERFQLFLLL